MVDGGVPAVAVATAAASARRGAYPVKGCASLTFISVAYQAGQGGLFRAVAVAVNGRAIRCPLRLPVNGLVHAMLLRL